MPQPQLSRSLILRRRLAPAGPAPAVPYPTTLALILDRRRRLLANPRMPTDLIDAIMARVGPLLVTPGPFTWIGTGIAPPGQALPYATIGEPSEDDSYWTTSGDAQADGRLEITCFAASRGASRTLGDRLAATLQDAPLRFLAGRLFYFRQSGRLNAKDPNDGPGGCTAWAEIRQFEYSYAY